MTISFETLPGRLTRSEADGDGDADVPPHLSGVLPPETTADADLLSWFWWIYLQSVLAFVRVDL